MCKKDRKTKVEKERKKKKNQIVKKPFAKSMYVRENDELTCI